MWENKGKSNRTAAVKDDEGHCGAYEWNKNLLQLERRAFYGSAVFTADSRVYINLAAKLRAFPSIASRRAILYSNLSGSHSSSPGVIAEAEQTNNIHNWLHQRSHRPDSNFLLFLFLFSAAHDE